MEPAVREQFFEPSPESTIEFLEQRGRAFAEWQRGVPWWIGDLARHAEQRWPNTWQQVFPEWSSPGLIERCKAVAKAYPKEEDRNPLATWTQHMKLANDPQRIHKLEEIVEKGLTSDESRKADPDVNRPRWLLGVDVHYHLHRHWFSGAGVEAAVRVAEWIQRTVARLKEKGLTDVVCCFDSRSSFRKDLTTTWEDRYKDRPPKDQELVQQLGLVWDLLEGHGYCCDRADGFEADDLMATYAKQFDGKVTLLSQDKDVRQCLSDHCNILLDVEWTEDEHSGDMLPEYKWLSAKQHTESTGIRPDQWAEYQCICGDSVDGVKGVAGIGEKGAKDLIQEFGTLNEVIQAAKDDDERIKPKKRQAILEFQAKVDVTRQLVTLRTDLPLQASTRI